MADKVEHRVVVDELLKYFNKRILIFSDKMREHISPRSALGAGSEERRIILLHLTVQFSRASTQNKATPPQAAKTQNKQKNHYQQKKRFLPLYTDNDKEMHSIIPQIFFWGVFICLFVCCFLFVLCFWGGGGLVLGLLFFSFLFFFFFFFFFVLLTDDVCLVRLTFQ